ncbi:hypothetical protein CBER1_08496 [Lecanosticta acicola]|uniref:F-box domain-containing protein n=1 Tax=Lecanosticta acicola TaxID=111012 RepID=A0AAI8YZH4_9PEZI|nr:hypothetical protein CBER1_08496 [Lecanosticta acicola]
MLSLKQMQRQYTLSPAGAIPGTQNAHPPEASPATSRPTGARDEAFTVIEPGKITKKAVMIDEYETLIDTTEALPLKSKKTERMQKKLQKKLKRTTVRSDTKSFLDLPPELLQGVLSHLQPRDIFPLLRLNKATREYILDNESAIARDIIRQRYWVLSRCFFLPVPLTEVEPSAHAALKNPEWQKRMQVHKRYQHVKPHDESNVCSCSNCVCAWNDLCLVLDLAHFQDHLSNRQPIPIIPRGTYPQWHTQLIERNAQTVLEANRSPLVYAMILQIHLDTIFSTLTRQVRVGKKTYHPKQLYHLSRQDVESQTDAFLERSGPPSYEFPFHRDKYHYLEAYVPNRKWSKEDQMWKYATPASPHQNNLAWVVERFTPEKNGLDKFVSSSIQQLQV